MNSRKTKRVCFSLSLPVFERLRELKEVKSINLSAYADKIFRTVLKIQEGATSEN